MKKNKKILFISIFLIAASMADAVSAMAAEYVGNNLSQNMTVAADEESEKSSDKGAEKSTKKDQDKDMNKSSDKCSDKNQDKNMNKSSDKNSDKNQDKNMNDNSQKNADENADVPKPVTANQLSANVVEITFNIPVNQESATKAGNYWVRSTEEEKPTGIATVGKNEKLSASNALTDALVKIEPSSESGRVYKMTFKNNIKSGAEHKLHIYFVAPKGVDVYKGENGAIIFKAK